MKCQADIIALANDKLKDAELLFNNGRYDAAYYLAGYHNELLLKARVCKTIGIADFFDFGNRKRFNVTNVDNITKPYKVHNYEQLLILSGIYTDFEAILASDTTFKANWSIIQAWSENARYLTGTTSTTVKDFITSSKYFSAWIHNYL